MDGTEVSSGLSTFDVVWARIVRLAGETFVTKTGKQFSYTADRAAVHLATTSRSLPRSGFSTALSRFPSRARVHSKTFRARLTSTRS